MFLKNLLNREKKRAYHYDSVNLLPEKQSKKRNIRKRNRVPLKSAKEVITGMAQLSGSKLKRQKKPTAQ